MIPRFRIIRHLLHTSCRMRTEIILLNHQLEPLLNNHYLLQNLWMKLNQWTKTNFLSVILTILSSLLHLLPQVRLLSDQRSILMLFLLILLRHHGLLNHHQVYLNLGVVGRHLANRVSDHGAMMMDHQNEHRHVRGLKVMMTNNLHESGLRAGMMNNQHGRDPKVETTRNLERGLGVMTTNSHRCERDLVAGMMICQDLERGLVAEMILNLHQNLNTSISVLIRTMKVKLQMKMRTVRESALTLIHLHRDLSLRFRPMRSVNYRSLSDR